MQSALSESVWTEIYMEKWGPKTLKHRSLGPPVGLKKHFLFLIIAINAPLVIARHLKNCLNRQIFKFQLVTERLMCDTGQVTKSKHRSKLKLILFIKFALFLKSSLKICQKQPLCRLPYIKNKKLCVPFCIWEAMNDSDRPSPCISTIHEWTSEPWALPGRMPYAA